MPEISIEHDETETQYLARTARGDLRELVGKVVNDLVRHGVDQRRADNTAAALVAAIEALEAEDKAGVGMVLQALEHAHRPQRWSLSAFTSVLTPHEACGHAAHAAFEAWAALCAAGRHPDFPAAMRAALNSAVRAAWEQAKLFQALSSAFEAGDVGEMDAAGNA